MLTNESRPDFKLGTLPIPPKYRDRVTKLSAFSEWTIYSAQPLVTPVPVFYDGIEHRYSWDDQYLVPMVDGKETDDCITVTVAAVDPDLSQPPCDEEDRIRRAWPTSFFSDSSKHEAWHRMVREQGLDGLFIVDNEGYSEAVINASSLNQYDLFRSAYLWLTIVVRSTSTFASYANWTPSDLEDKVLTELKSADSVLHHKCMRYLARHPESIFQIHPRKFESLVASILRHLGYKVHDVNCNLSDYPKIVLLVKICCFCTH